MKKICEYVNRDCIDYVVPEDATHDLDKIEKIIESESDLTHIFTVYCETTSGILNPIDKIAKIAEKNNISLFIEAMSAFGALPLRCKPKANFRA